MFDILPDAIGWITGISTVVASASAITAITPTQKDNKYQKKTVDVLNVLLRILNVLALNVGKAKNRDDSSK